MRGRSTPPIVAQRGWIMYTNILIPTDGSELSNKAIRHGIALAKTCNAKVTGITVTIPFHVLAMDPGTITDTAESYKKRTSTAAAKYLAQLNDGAAAAGVPCTVINAEHEHPYQAIIDAASKRRTQCCGRDMGLRRGSGARPETISDLGLDAPDGPRTGRRRLGHVSRIDVLGSSVGLLFVEYLTRRKASVGFPAASAFKVLPASSARY